MSYFIDDLKAYLITAGLMTTADAVEGFDDATSDSLTCLYTYDNDPEVGQYSIQIMRRDPELPESRDNCAAIYNHFFSARNPKPVRKDINGVKCLFKPLKAPMFLKNENNFIYYTANMEVWTQKL